MKLNTSLLASAIILSLGSAEAVTLVQYNFDPAMGSAFAATTTAPGTSNADIANSPSNTLGGSPAGLFNTTSSSGNNVNGSGITTVGTASGGTASGNLLNFRANQGQTQSEAAATSAGIPTSGEYFSFSLSAVGSNTLDLETLSFDMGKGGDGNDRGVVVWYSTDDFTTSANTFRLGTGGANTAVIPNATSNQLARNVSFSLASLADTTESIGFRFMTTNIGGNTVQFDNITVSGEVIPEPSAFSLLGVCGALALMRRKR